MDVATLRQADKTNFELGETWYVVSQKWLIQLLQHAYQPEQHPAPGPVTNEHLLDDDRNRSKPDIVFKRDYRAVCSRVWELFTKHYGSVISIAFRTKEHVDMPGEWEIVVNLPLCVGVAPPKSLFIELVPHAHTVKCNRRVSVCDTPGKFREREIVRVVGASGEEVDRIVWWRRRRRLGEDHADSSRDDADLDMWEQISGCAGTTQYVIRPEESEHLVRAQYLYRKSDQVVGLEGEERLMLSNIVGPCEESGPMIHEIRVIGAPVVGGVLVADVDYWGGTEGASTYQWTRVKNGVRTKTKVQSIDWSSHRRFDARTLDELRKKGVNDTIRMEDVQTTEDDPRCHAITEDDVDSMFKVSCTPLKQDGLVGEPKTSRPTKAVER
jgi:hypothetical protein